MTDDELEHEIAKHGCGGKLVRAICRRMGWRHGAQGAPLEWFDAWPATGAQIERVLISTVFSGHT